MAGWLKAAIEQTGITKFQLSRDSGVSRSYIYKLLEGGVSDPRRDTMQRLARALKASQPDMGKLPRLDREMVTSQALLKQAIADLDHVTGVLRKLRKALAGGLIFKDRRGRKPKGQRRRG
jgi:transcriptional regulator with XRE-family HTH domain